MAAMGIADSAALFVTTASRTMLLWLSRVSSGFFEFISGLVELECKWGCWVADKTGMGRSGGRLL